MNSDTRNPNKSEYSYYSDIRTIRVCYYSDVIRNIRTYVLTTQIYLLIDSSTIQSRIFGLLMVTRILKVVLNLQKSCEVLTKYILGTLYTRGLMFSRRWLQRRSVY